MCIRDRVWLETISPKGGVGSNPTRGVYINFYKYN
jgi:hypothetical protein